jgi:ribosomal protein S19
MFDYLMLKFEILKLSKKTVIKAKHLNKTIKIYNGQKHYEFIVTKQMLNFKTGCFLSTRSDYFYKKSK